jgi:hypothetical protein
MLALVVLIFAVAPREQAIKGDAGSTTPQIDYASLVSFAARDQPGLAFGTTSHPLRLTDLALRVLPYLCSHTLGIG